MLNTDKEVWVVVWCVVGWLQITSATMKSDNQCSGKSTFLASDAE